MAPETPREKQVELEVLRLFDFALILKAIDGVIEIIGAALMLVLPPAVIVRIAEFVTAGEFARDPDDPVATTIRALAHSFAVHPHYFVSAYLALHGLAKALLVVGIFAGKRVAYPLFVVALGIFGSYEAYRGIVRHETLLQIFALFDIILLILTAYEYRRRYPLHATPRPDIS